MSYFNILRDWNLDFYSLLNRDFYIASLNNRNFNGFFYNFLQFIYYLNFICKKNQDEYMSIKFKLLLL